MAHGNKNNIKSQQKNQGKGGKNLSAHVFTQG